VDIFGNGARTDHPCPAINLTECWFLRQLGSHGNSSLEVVELPKRGRFGSALQYSRNMLACDVSVCPLKGAASDEDPGPILHQRLIFATIMFLKKPSFAMQCCQMLKNKWRENGRIPDWNKLQVKYASAGALSSSTNESRVLKKPRIAYICHSTVTRDARGLAANVLLRECKGLAIPSRCPRVHLHDSISLCAGSLVRRRFLVPFYTQVPSVRGVCEVPCLPSLGHAIFRFIWCGLPSRRPRPANPPSMGAFWF
jgi:hypothetical protein